ncbi:hypothetical protein PG996_004788 [Apiospora saccharicola]|uniref:Uncharacterized protein n=1 Tax=Apiospora saccharicola TaxID=335842 RepID=A0ABR1W8X5_9PEZI
MVRVGVVRKVDVDIFIVVKKNFSNGKGVLLAATVPELTAAVRDVVGVISVGNAIDMGGEIDPGTVGGSDVDGRLYIFALDFQSTIGLETGWVLLGCWSVARLATSGLGDLPWGRHVVQSCYMANIFWL